MNGREGDDGERGKSFWANQSPEEKRRHRANLAAYVPKTQKQKGVRQVSEADAAYEMLRDGDFDYTQGVEQRLHRNKGVKTMVHPNKLSNEAAAARVVAAALAASVAKPQPKAQPSGGLTFLNAKDIEVPWLHVFLMGDMGSGKTKLASTFPKPVFLVPRNEQSMITLKGLNFPYVEIDSMRGPVVNGVGGMLSALSGLETMYAKDPDKFPFDTIVIEQIGHYGDIVQRELSNQTMQMDQQKWGQFLAHFGDIQAKLRRMQVHVVWTSHTKIEKISDTTSICGANISGQTATKIPSSCDIVAYCETGSGNARKFRTHFQRYMGFNARARFDIPPVIENCTYNDIAQYLSASEAEGV